MKKRLLIPSLLLLSATSLTACEGAGASFVKNGQPYTEGAAQRVSPALRAQKEGSVKAVKVTSKTNIKMKMSIDGKKYSIGAKVSGAADIDLDNRTIVGNYTTTASVSGMSGSSKVKFSARDRGDGTFVFVSGENYEASFTEASLSALFDEASYSIYSWNYTIDSQNLADALEGLEGQTSESVDGNSVANQLSSNFVFNGDFESGTFDVGLAKAITIRVSGLSLVFDKFIASYKDCFIKSSTIGIKLDYTQDGESVSLALTYSDTYSYTKRSASNNQTPGFGF